MGNNRELRRYDRPERAIGCQDFGLVLARGGMEGIYICAYCGKRCSPREATVDRVLPLSRGSRSSWGNTVTACFACNQRKAGSLRSLKLRLRN